MNALGRINDMVDSNGHLHAYAWGGYPIYYVDKDNDVLCPDCATDTDELDPPVVAADINWEDDDLYCDGCSKRIESAYGEEVTA